MKQRIKYVYGICDNNGTSDGDKCPKCRSRAIQRHKVREEFICDVCGAELTPVPTPADRPTGGKKFFFILAGGISIAIIAYFAISHALSPTCTEHSATSNSELLQAVNVLVDADLTADQRLDSIPSIQNRFFSPDAHVITVGENGKTKVMYEDISDFLLRLALSNKIKKIDVLDCDKDSLGKNIAITVKEVFVEK